MANDEVRRFVYAIEHQGGGTGDSDWRWAEWEGGYGSDGESSNPVAYRSLASAEAALPRVQATCDYGCSIRKIDRWDTAILKD